jgi:hypothetical protein
VAGTEQHGSLASFLSLICMQCPACPVHCSLPFECCVCFLKYDRRMWQPHQGQSVLYVDVAPLACCLP